MGAKSLPPFTPIFPPNSKRLPFPKSLLSNLIKDSFSLRSLVLLGALTQTLISLFLPHPYLPATILLLITIVTHLHSILTFSVPPIPTTINTKLTRSHLNTPIPHRTTTSFPLASYNPSVQDTPYSPTHRPGLALLHLTVRFSHPLGVLHPGARDLQSHFLACNKRLLSESKAADRFGCMGISSWRGDTLDTNNTFMTAYYFKNVEGLHAFAHDEVHMKAWVWFEGWAKKWGLGRIGVAHETFVVGENGFEGVGLGMPATLLAGGSMKVKREDGDQEQWWGTMVAAGRGGMEGRLGRSIGRHGGKNVEE
ncbi:hypothetical protein OQA88_2505 [Cercophora sp. LCS_1]